MSKFDENALCVYVCVYDKYLQVSTETETFIKVDKWWISHYNWAKRKIPLTDLWN